MMMQNCELTQFIQLSHDAPSLTKLAKLLFGPHLAKGSFRKVWAVPDYTHVVKIAYGDDGRKMNLFEANPAMNAAYADVLPKFGPVAQDGSWLVAEYATVLNGLEDERKWLPVTTTYYHSLAEALMCGAIHHKKRVDHTAYRIAQLCREFDLTVHEIRGNNLGVVRRPSGPQLVVIDANNIDLCTDY